MKWYAAHLVLYVQFKDARQDHYPIWENIVLIRARTEAEAFRKAEKRGQTDAGDDEGSFRWGGKAATWVFAGVRKLTSCEDATARPNDGAEVTFLELQTASKREIERFVAGEPAAVKFMERFRDDEDVGARSTTETQVSKRTRSTEGHHAANGESRPLEPFCKDTHSAWPVRQSPRKRLKKRAPVA